jgi:hypothetical protein
LLRKILPKRQPAFAVLKNSSFLFFSFSHPFSPFAVHYIPKESALRGRIALPDIKNVLRKMRDTACETSAVF